MGDRRCCCDSERLCIICLDNFTRPDSDSIAPFLVEQEPCSISSNRLKVESGGWAYCPTRHPVVGWTAVLDIDLVNMASGNEYIFFVNFDPVEKDYEGVKVVCNDATFCTVSFYPFGTGSLANIPYGPPDHNNEMTWRICRNQNAIWVENSNTEGLLFAVLDRSEYDDKRRYAGVINLGSNDIYFGDFVYLEHHYTNPICDCCWCPCGAETGGGFCPEFGEIHSSLPRTVLATFSVSGSDCPQWFIDAVDGLEVELTVDDETYGQSSQEYIVWYGSVEGPNETNTGNETYELWLYCHNTLPYEGQFQLCGASPTIFGPLVGDLPDGATCSGIKEDDTVCEPLSLSYTFGEWALPVGDDCWLDIIITEAP